MVETEDVRKVAENARINVSDDEISTFVDEFDQILSKFEKLQEVDTDGVEPAFHPVEVESETRADQEEECLNHEQVFANSENVEDNMFKGPSA